MIAVAGHRDVVEEKIRPDVRDVLARAQKDHDDLICGMAKGSDIIMGEVAQKLGYNVMCAIPYRDHPRGGEVLGSSRPGQRLRKFFAV